RAMDPELIPELEMLFASRTFDEWRILENAECCVSGALSPAEVAQDPQVQALGLILSDESGAVRVAPPVSLAATPSRPGTRAPAKGEHTDEVLRERLGLDPATLRELHARGVIMS